MSRGRQVAAGLLIVLSVAGACSPERPTCAWNVLAAARDALDAGHPEQAAERLDAALAGRPPVDDPQWSCAALALRLIARAAVTEGAPVDAELAALLAHCPDAASAAGESPGPEGSPSP